MRRREFIAGLGGTVAWPAAARAQQGEKTRRIGMLNGFSESNPTVRSLAEETFQALARLGWENGRNVQIVQHWAAGDLNRTAMRAKELVALAVATSLKARVMLSLGYGCGLRANEVVRLKVKHIDSAQKIIRIEQSKGRKDRNVMLSPETLDLLRQW